MFSQILISTLEILGSFYITLVILRFLLQLSRADFYNPITQFIVKATNPLILPLRRVIPGLGGVDLAAIVLALILQIVLLLIILTVASPAGAGFPPLLPLLGVAIIKVLQLTLQIYFVAIIAVIILSWVAPGSRHPGAMLLVQLTEPVLAPIRRLLPSLGGLDLSPIVVFLIINALTIMLDHSATLMLR
ncbi:YggT family protein [Allohahella sp. A8]|uniref:YggT family protein n=1 Tax=Allohahella sp. A8 TaxID=3141461 RepID=UPI000C0B90F3|nr:YggT family protein [Hahellaceae bacterium]|tara:strand:- start:12966 stop:13532 length:567 start_codon:yes stop_codon:yes gene_type:complete